MRQFILALYRQPQLLINDTPCFRVELTVPAEGIFGEGGGRLKSLSYAELTWSRVKRVNSELQQAPTCRSYGAISFARRRSATLKNNRDTARQDWYGQSVIHPHGAARRKNLTASVWSIKLIRWTHSIGTTFFFNFFFFPIR